MKKENLNLTEKSQEHGKLCSICGNWFPSSEFTYGNRENRSYCQKCDKEEKSVYSKGGAVAAREYREDMRTIWKKPNE